MQNSDRRIPDSEIQAAGGEWAGYGELSGPALLSLMQQDKLRFVFANNSIVVSIQRQDGVVGDYQLLHTVFAPPAAPAPPAPPVQPNGGTELSSELDKLWTFQELLPLFQKYGAQYGFDYRVIAAICNQESGFRNWRVHTDGTGFGLFGLDDNGLLPDFERWSSLAVGRGSNHSPVSPNKQIEYAAYQLARYKQQLGDPILAAQAWHRGMGGYTDELGVNYGQLIRAHISKLFPTT